VKVLKLFKKPAHQTPMQECDRLLLWAGCGIEGDVNARMGSPRQILMVDARSLQQFGLEAGALRENIVVDAPTEAFVSGQVWQVGAALIRPTFLCEPCAYINQLRPGLATAIVGSRGRLGMVVKSGTVAVGDAIAPTAEHFPPLADSAKERFQEFVARVPPGKVITTQDLVLALGVTRAHYRVFPAFIKTFVAELPVHRIVDIQGNLLTKHLPNQAEQLAAEEVRVENDRVSMGDRWTPDQFH
jgi:alkylated DNA nucleotide flippase Atl1